MEPTIKVLTLGVEDLDASVRFYRDGLSLPIQGIFGSDEDESTVAFFDVNEDMILALYPRAWLAKDAGVPLDAGTAGSFSIGHNVTGREEVDAVVAEAEAAGARVVDPPRDRVWGGYSGYFQDPDGHLWEIVWNPAMSEG